MFFKLHEERRKRQDISLPIDKPPEKPAILLKCDQPIKILEKPLNNFEITKPETSYPSFHERYINYQKVRSRIFNDPVQESPRFSKRVKRLHDFRQRSRLQKTAYKHISSLDEIRWNDDRPFASVILEGIEVKGLLDSGANISALGNNSHDFLKQIGVPILKMDSSVTTSDGTRQEILGFVILKVTG